MRTFISVEIPEQMRQCLASVCAASATRLADEGLAPLLRWSDSGKAHLTLRFLGETSTAQRQTIGAMLGEVAAKHPPFSLALDGLGAFPNWRRLRVLWVGITGDLALLGRLQADIEQGARACGFAAESSAFHPHVTLARISRDADYRLISQVGALLSAQPALAQRLGQWRVSELVWMRSDLQPGGSLYTPQGSYRLGAETLSS
ncbi:MAG: RNA 2',3'-cyclic phosphodiesterase [Chloroflexi bacterium]|nr:MAG: RNA 2',3'-cyclic phosphodiesterase [Chloroflexota bacterium]